MLIYLARHGETASNRDALGLGRANVPLTGRGRRQAAALGGRMATTPLSAVYTSPLSRCLETARAIAGERDVPVVPCPELLELDVGETEGMPFPEMREKHGDFMRAWTSDGGLDTRMPGGESMRDLESRLAPFLAQLPADGPDIAIVSHNFVTKALLCALLKLDLGAFRSLNTDLASLSVVAKRDGRTMLRSLNDTCHLHGLEP